MGPDFFSYIKSWHQYLSFVCVFTEYFKTVVLIVEPGKTLVGHEDLRHYQPIWVENTRLR